ncbi:hypothetical protein ACN9MB_12950 [Dyella kyungheensis]|uniref:hypothetical protein n=1 Tax=Dyella kyungheensis TaxID=1242174 RepID=UPI003CEBC420
MAPNDALFAVRVLHDSPGIVATLWSIAQTLIGVVAGGFITYFVTRGAERRTAQRDTHVLARSLAAELRASKHILEMQLQFAAEAGQDAAIDTVRYGQVNKAAHPVVRAAAASAGQFAEPIGEVVTKFAFLLVNLAQQQQIITELRKAGILTEEKLQLRLNVLFIPLVKDAVATRDILLELLDTHYQAAVPRAD